MVHIGLVLSNSLRLPLSDTHALPEPANGMAQAATAHEAQARLRQEINAAALEVFEDRSQLEEGVVKLTNAFAGARPYRRLRQA